MNTFCVQSLFWVGLGGNRGVYEIMCKNIVERVRPQMTIWRTRNACWIIFIAFPLQQCLLERASMSRVCLSVTLPDMSTVFEIWL